MGFSPNKAFHCNSAIILSDPKKGGGEVALESLARINDWGGGGGRKMSRVDRLMSWMYWFN